TLGLGGSVTYTPAPTFTGNDSFTYTVSDGLLTATGTVFMEVGGGTGTNSNPVAVNDTASTPEDVAVNINVLANDTDPNTGDTKTVASVTAAANGSVVINSDGTVKYTPNLNFNGSD